VRLECMRKTHDLVTDRDGVFDKAVAMIKEGKSLGYTVCTNTTIYRETDMDEIEEMCAFLQGIGVDGMLLSPGYHYEKIRENHFLLRTRCTPSSPVFSSCLSATACTRRPCSWSSPPGGATTLVRPGGILRAPPGGGRDPAISLKAATIRRGANSGRGSTGTIGRPAAIPSARTV